MGWQNEKYPAHEGYLIGYVLRDGCAPDGNCTENYSRRPRARRGTMARGVWRALRLAVAALGTATARGMGTGHRVGLRGG